MEKTHALTLLAVPALASALWVDALSLYADVASVGDQAEYFPPPSVEEGIHEARVLETSQVVPGPGLPSRLRTQLSNNTLDAIRHQGRVYLAFRTASKHHSSADARVHVLSTNDEQTWVEETAVSTGSEIRQPRFLSYQDKLYLYVSQPRTGLEQAAPATVVALHRDHAGWTNPRTLDLQDHVVWNTKVQDGIPLMSASASKGLFLDAAPSISLFTTTDGYDWHPLRAGHSTVFDAGGGEAAFTGDDDGNLFSLISHSAGNASGWGSSVCFAPAREWTDWDCVNDPKRYDSPTMFTHEGEVYLIGRRNLTKDGVYDRGVGPEIVRTLTNQLDYVTAGKRCSLWRYVKSERRIAFVLDLPSRGDTCSPAVVKGTQAGQFTIYNYSSALNGPELNLGRAQAERTFVYRHVLSLSRTPRDRRSSL